MAVINRPKILLGEMNWQDDPTQSSYLMSQFLVADESGITIPSLTVEFDFRRGIVVHDCKFTFTLFAHRGNQRRRVYQIEVMPKERRSHQRKDVQLYGPHQHFGDDAERLDMDGLGCFNHEEWLHEFCRRASILYGGTYISPTEGNLF